MIQKNKSFRNLKPSLPASQALMIRLQLSLQEKNTALPMGKRTLHKPEGKMMDVTLSVNGDASTLENIWQASLVAYLA
jgi:hypothetical protein